MRHLYDSVASELARREIRLSARRAKVLEYLCAHQDHPTVDEIYLNLLREIPTLSRTTVYNTLHILLDAGLVREVAIDENQLRYDIVTKDHGHLKCIECGTIYNFALNHAALATDDLGGFRVLDRNVYFKGICPRCLSTADYLDPASASAVNNLEAP